MHIRYDNFIEEVAVFGGFPEYNQRRGLTSVVGESLPKPLIRALYTSSRSPIN